MDQVGQVVPCQMAEGVGDLLQGVVEDQGEVAGRPYLAGEEVEGVQFPQEGAEEEEVGADQSQEEAGEGEHRRQA